MIFKYTSLAKTIWVLFIENWDPNIIFLKPIFGMGVKDLFNKKYQKLSSMDSA